LSPLLWFEANGDPASAKRCENTMKNWVRDWATNLIECDNPNWIDRDLSLLCPVTEGYIGRE
jgi:predicted GIY-YIG superfamily endonuclease